MRNICFDRLFWQLVKIFSTSAVFGKIKTWQMKIHSSVETGEYTVNTCYLLLWHPPQTVLQNILLSILHQKFLPDGILLYIADT